MIEWTTPTLPLRIKGGNILASNVKVLITFAQSGYRLNIEPMNLTATEDGVTCEVHISQLESGKFHSGIAKAQANVIDSNNLRAASKFASVNIGSNLFPEVMTYE